MRKPVIAALVMGVLLTLAAIRAVDLWWWRAQALGDARDRAGGLALILAEYVRGTFAASDASLRHLALHSRRAGGPEAPDDAWAPSLAAAKAGLTGIGSISVVDAKGIIRHATLPAIVDERLATALVSEQRARRETEEAARLKEEFLMTVSHELRTPLTAIAGWAQMLESGLLNDRQKAAAVQTIARHARAQTRLIEDLLDMSRIVGGELRLDVRPINVDDVIHQAVESLQPAADAKRVALETSIDRASGSIVADPERLQQIVWNLLSNAIKFTPAGGRVEVHLERPEGGGAIDLVVRDTGIGIAPDFLPHVFERFRQADSGARRRHGGLGLGLAIVRHLVELHGGTVTAESEGEGRGATFRVRLPIRKTKPPAGDAAPSHVELVE